MKSRKPKNTVLNINTVNSKVVDFPTWVHKINDHGFMIFKGKCYVL